MKTLFCIVLMMMFAANVYASDVYFGKYINSKYSAQPGGKSNAEYVAGVVVDKKIYFLTPRAELQTLMDSYNDNGSFHPASIKYDIGVRADIYEGIYADVSRMCWHGIDSVGKTEEYWLVKVGYHW